MSANQDAHLWRHPGYPAATFALASGGRGRRFESFRACLLYMVVETFGRGPEPVYRRAAENGRMLPDGLVYLDSWVALRRGGR